MSLSHQVSTYQNLLRNSKARLLFVLSLVLFGIAGFFQAEVDLPLIGLKVAQRPELARYTFIAAVVTLLGSLFCTIAFGKDIFPSVEKILKYYVGRKGGLDFAVYFKNAGDLSKGTYFVNEKELKSVLVAFDHTDVEPKEMIELWLALAKKIHQATLDLDEVLKPTAHGLNARVVLDTECGGMFYTRIDGKRFVFGATLDQRRLHNDTADREMRDIVRAFRDFLSVHAN